MRKSFIVMIVVGVIIASIAFAWKFQREWNPAPEFGEGVTWSETATEYYEELFPHMLAVTYSLKSIFKATAEDATPAIAEGYANDTDGIVHVSDVREAIAFRWANSTKTSMTPAPAHQEALAVGYVPPFEITPNEPFRDMESERRLRYAREKVTIQEYAAAQKYSEAAPLDPPYYDAPQVYERTQELLAAEKLTYDLSTDAGSYFLNQEIPIQFSLTNPTDEAITLKFPTAKQLDYTIYGQDGTLLYTWSDSQSFAATTTEIVVPAQDIWLETITHTSDLHSLLPGDYEIEATIVGYYNTRTSQSVIKVQIATVAE